jgi:hypothetical protein
MSANDAIDVLLLIARPAAGKSEIIDYLKKLDGTTRLEQFHLHPFEEIDDFPMLWTWFEEDDILTRLGCPRLHSDDQGYFLGNHLWNVLIERICIEYHKKLRKPDYHHSCSTIIEFSRGKEHGGYHLAFEHLSRELIERMGVLYVQVSWEESLRKNRRRFNPDRPDSILEHGLEDQKLERLYKEIDWDEVSAADPYYLNIQGIKVPYVVFENEDDITTPRGEALGARLKDRMQTLWKLYNL